MVNDSEDVDGMQDAGVAILRAYNYVVQEVDGYHAFQILTHVCFFFFQNGKYFLRNLTHSKTVCDRSILYLCKEKR